MDERFKTTDFVVEATSFEVMTLWERHRDEVTWNHDNSGHLVTVGDILGFPVNISVYWTTVDGLEVLFWEAVSRVVDNDMIIKWFDENCCPTWDNGTRRARTNAMNFHHVLREARQRK